MKNMWCTVKYSVIFLLLFGKPVTSMAQDQCEDKVIRPELADIKRAIVSTNSDDTQIHMQTTVDDTDMNRLLKVAHERTEIARDLGVGIPKFHDLVMLHMSELTALVTNGGHPVPHNYDGARIVNGAHNMMGILEFVEGARVSRSFYVSTWPFKTVAAVISHVIGHNDFAITSHYNLARIRDLQRPDGDPQGDRAEMAEAMHQLLTNGEYDPEDIAFLYDLIADFSMLQDFATGSFEAPSDLVPETIGFLDKKKASNAATKRLLRIAREEDPGDVAEADDKHNSYKAILPVRPTTSVLQALVAYTKNRFGEDHPKTKLITQYEQIVRFIAANPLNQTINEGWATTMDAWLLARHANPTSADIITYAEKATWPARTNLLSPYALGHAAWMNIWHAVTGIKDVKELENLTEDEIKALDQKFVAHSRSRIAYGDSPAILNEGLTDEWVRTNNLFIKRPLTYNEFDHNKQPDPRHPELNHQYKIVTRDPAKIRKQFIELMSTPINKIPLTEAVEFDGGTKPYIHMRHKVHNDWPLERGTMAQVLFKIAHWAEKPVRFDTVATVLWDPEKINPYYEYVVRGGWVDPREHLVGPMSVYVDPDGKVKVVINDDKIGYLASTIERQLQGTVNSLKSDLAASFSEEFASSAKLDTVISDLVDKASGKQVKQLSRGSYSPHVNRAIGAYLRIAPKRIRRFIEMIAEGKKKLNMSQPTVQVRVVPQRPTFSYDEKVRYFLNLPQQFSEGEDTVAYDKKLALLDLISAEAKVTPEGRIVYQREDKSNPGFMSLSGLGQGSDNEGDIVWGPPLPGNGGPGDPGEEPGGEDGDNPAQGPKLGDDPGDFIEVSVEDLMEAVAERLEIPNLNSRGGKTAEVTRVSRSSRRRNMGEVNVKRTGKDALKKGMAAMLAKVLKEQGVLGDIEDIDSDEAMRLGVTLLPTDQYFRRHKGDVVRPDKKVVVVLVRDGSGSMMGDPTSYAIQFAKILKFLLKKNYKQIEFRYVIFDVGAEEVEWKDFISKTKWGGTAYPSGVKKGYEITQEDKYQSWDRVLVTIGDGVDYQGEEVAKIYQEFIDGVRGQNLGAYGGMLITEGGWGPTADFLKSMEGLQDREPWFATSFMRSMDEVVDSIKTLFKNDENSSNGG